MVFTLKNNQLLPFERNRYYVGKLLTSADFQIEQSYSSQKRRFLNELMFGSGIACGLNVYSLDDVSIMVESGVAVDGFGREIVIENSVMSKLSSIDGFDNLKSSHAVLCLRYEEEKVNPVYSVTSGNQGEGYEFNRIKEGYSLYLCDRTALPVEKLSLASFLSSSVLYEDSDYSVTVNVPVAIPCGQQVRLSVTVKQLSGSAQPISLSVPIQTPSLISENGEHACTVVFEDLLLSQGKSVTYYYWLTASPVLTSESTLMAGADDIKVTVGGSSRSAAEPFMLKVSIVSLSSGTIIARSIGSVSLEELNLEGRSELVELAEFTLQRTKNAYIIESVVEDGVKRYIKTNAAEALREEYCKWFSSASSVSSPVGSTAVSEPIPSVSGSREPMYATGICELSVPANVKPGQIVYSDEIIHGLGKGLVYVSAGFEYFNEDKKLKSTARNTIYGDPLLFASEELPLPSSNIAVRVLNDRGSFIVAVRIDSMTPMVVLSVRWNAFLLHSGDDKIQKIEGKSISAARPTVVLATRESYYFSVNFKNMEPCTLAYELTDKDSGSITPDGIYTAPGKEGIYEIRISCADLPLISTYAYAVVKKRNAEDKDEAQA